MTLPRLTNASLIIRPFEVSDADEFVRTAHKSIEAVGMIQKAIAARHSLHEMVSQQQKVANSEDNAIKLINYYIPSIEEQIKVNMPPTELLDITGAFRTSNII